MRRFAWALALTAAALTPLYAQEMATVRSTLATAWDMDGEAADADQVVAGPDALADSTAYVVDASPDVCRLVDITVVDGDSSILAGTLTVTGTGCLGSVRTCSFTFAGGGSGVKTLTCTDGHGAYFSTVTAVSTGALTGEDGADTLTVGYASNSVLGWPMYGRITTTADAMGVVRVDPMAYFDVGVKVTTSGALSTTLAAVTASSAPYANVAVGDLLILQVGGTSFERKVTARADADSVTLSSAINVPAAGVTFRYKKAYFSTDPLDVLYIPVQGYRTALVDWSVDANANTGGVIMLLQCTQERVEFPTARWVQVQTTTVASGATQGNSSESIDLSLLPFSYCRMGFYFGTGDTADVADEDINAAFSLSR